MLAPITEALSLFSIHKSYLNTHLLVHLSDSANIEHFNLKCQVFPNVSHNPPSHPPKKTWFKVIIVQNSWNRSCYTFNTISLPVWHIPLWMTHYGYPPFPDPPPPPQMIQANNLIIVQNSWNIWSGYTF